MAFPFVHGSISSCRVWYWDPARLPVPPRPATFGPLPASNIPVDPQTPNPLVFLTSASTEFEGEAIASTLRSQGIPAAVFSAAARTMQWEAGYQAGAQIHVRASDRAAAADILREARLEQRMIDWDQVDVGEGEDLGTLPTPGPRVRGLSPWLASIREIGLVAIILLNVLWAVPSAVIGPVAVSLAVAGVVIWLRSISMKGRGEPARPVSRRR